MSFEVDPRYDAEPGPRPNKEIPGYRHGDTPRLVGYPGFPSEYLPLTPEHMRPDDIVYVPPNAFIVDRQQGLFVDGQTTFTPDKLHPSRPAAGCIGLMCMELSTASRGERCYIADIRRMVIGSILTTSETIEPDASLHSYSNGLRPFLPVKVIVSRHLDGRNRYDTLDKRLIPFGKYLAEKMDYAFDGDQIALQFPDQHTPL